MMKRMEYSILINISDDDDDDEGKFIKETPSHPRERLKCLSRNRLIRNQANKNYNPQILDEKNSIQKNKITKLNTDTVR